MNKKPQRLTSVYDLSRCAFG